jgi:hypothetical protein
MIANPTKEEELKEFPKGDVGKYLALEHNLQEKTNTEMDFHGLDITIGKVLPGRKVMSCLPNLSTIASTPFTLYF